MKIVLNSSYGNIEAEETNITKNISQIFCNISQTEPSAEVIFHIRPHVSL